jgi:hypothetical protein
MAGRKKLSVLGKDLSLGERMATGKRWRLLPPGRKNTFKGELIARFDAKLSGRKGDLDLALFRVYR